MTKRQDVQPEESQYRNYSMKRPRLADNNLGMEEYEAGTPVAIYIRVSSDEQVGEGHYSLDAQQAKCQELANQRGWNVVEVYEDAGFSAKDDNRPEFQRLMDDARAGRFKSILVHKLDRFMRSIELIARYFRELGDLNVMLTSVSENFDFSSPHGRMYFYMLAVFAQWYLENLSAEVIKAKEQMAIKGIQNGRLPFGYVKDEETRIPMIVPDQAAAIHKVFELYSTGTYSDRELANIFNEMGFITGRGRSWSKDTMRNMLRNEFYYGVVAHRKSLYPGRHDAIISRELFDQAQETRRTRSQRVRGFSNAKERNAPHFLQGLIRCGLCKRPLRIVTAKKKHYYKECSEERGLSCENANKRIRMESKYFKLKDFYDRGADEMVLDILQSFRLPENWQDEIEARIEEMDVRKKIETKRKRLDERLRKLAVAYSHDAFSDEEYFAKRQAMLDEKSMLIIPDQAALIEMGSRLDTLKPYLEEATEDEKSAISHLLLEAVYTDRELVCVEKIQPNREFIDLFRLVAREMGWEEEEHGIFVVNRNP